MAELALQTLAGCGLAIGAYPRFRYDARGGGGVGVLAAADPVGADIASGPGHSTLRFDPATLRIPPLDWRTTRFLGLPLPPGLAITIHPEQLEGCLDAATGTMALRFEARFRFAIGALYRAPRPDRRHHPQHRSGAGPPPPGQRPAPRRRGPGAAGGRGHHRPQR